MKINHENSIKTLIKRKRNRQMVEEHWATQATSEKARHIHERRAKELKRWLRFYDNFTDAFMDKK